MSSVIDQPGVEHRVLVLASRSKDAELIAKMLATANIDCTICVGLSHFAAELYAGAGVLITAEEVLEKGANQVVRQYLRQQPTWADLPLLIMTHHGANSAAAAHATATLGNVTLLERPTRKTALLSAVRTALRAREKQYEIRSHIMRQQRTTEALRESERLYRGIGESINYGIWVCDASGKNTYVSDSFLQLIGFTQAQCAGFGWLSVLHPDEAEQALKDWQACVKKGKIWDREHRIRGQDGRYHPVLARGVPIRDDSGRIVQWVGINLDISKVKKAQQLLADADRRKDEFLATLAHELRNPLAPIRNMVEFLRQGDASQVNLESIRDVLDRQSAQLTRLVDDLLDVARITKGGIKLQKTKVDLANVIRNAVETSNAAMTAAGIRFNLNLTDHSLFLEADPVRLAQSLSNLLNNAVKFTPEGGAITMDVGRSGSEVTITVTDTGIGMNAETLPEIFNMFTQAKEAKGHVQGGLGIGLALVKQFVEMHGGTVAAESPGPGKGSRFIVRLPLIQEPVDIDTSNQAIRKAADAKTVGRKILVVDDNQDSADSLSLLLSLYGAEVTTAYDGIAAIETASSFLPDVIILDIGLPGMNGYDAARRIRSLPGGDRITLIAATGWGQTADRLMSKSAGFDHHLVKPIELNMLMSLLP